MHDQTDFRRRIPRTDALLATPELQAACATWGVGRIKGLVNNAQQQARQGDIAPEAVLDAVIASLPHHASSLRRVINATGVVIHTNLGRAPLAQAAVDALIEAAGYTDVELDVATGQRGRRGAGLLDALIDASGAQDAVVVNNGAAALLLATTALAGEVIVSRGELVEIGDGFRIPELIASTGTVLREVGTTNRTHLRDYQEAITERTGCLLKVHPSNYWMGGFTASVEISELATLGKPVVVDLGSGLLQPDADLPNEPDAATALAQGADLVTCSGDKLLGGPQAGIIVGRADLVQRLRRHPMARALRVDKLTMGALEATILAAEVPVTASRRHTPDSLRARTESLAGAVGGQVVDAVGRVGGGGAPGVELPGLAVALPEALAALLRTGAPAVLARVERGRTLVDLRCVPASDDAELADAIVKALAKCE